GPAAREVDRGDDPSGEVGMRRDAAVEDRDADSLTGHAELAPGLWRSDLEDAGARRETRSIQRVECRGHDLIERDVGDIRVVRERQDPTAAEDRGGATDDRKTAADLAIRALHRRRRALGMVAAVQLA